MPHPLQTHSSIEEPARHEDVGQPQPDKRLCGVLGQSAIAPLVESLQPLDNREDVRHARTHTRLAAVRHPRNVLAGAVRTRWLVMACALRAFDAISVCWLAYALSP